MILYISLEKISTRKFIAMASKKIPLSKKPRAQPKTQTRGMKKSMQGGGISLTMTQVKEAIALLKDAGTFNTFSSIVFIAALSIFSMTPEVKLLDSFIAFSI